MQLRPLAWFTPILTLFALCACTPQPPQIAPASDATLSTGERITIDDSTVEAILCNRMKLGLGTYYEPSDCVITIKNGKILIDLSSGFYIAHIGESAYHGKIAPALIRKIKSQDPVQSLRPLAR